MRLRTAIFFVALLTLVGIFASPLRELIRLSFHEGYSSHLVLAPALAAYLVWMSRRNVFAVVESSELPAAVFAGFAFLGIWIAREYGSILNENDRLSITILSFFFFIVAIFLGTF